MSSNITSPDGGQELMLMMDGRTTGPAVAVVVLREATGVADGARLRAELDGRLAVGTQVLIIESAGVPSMDPVELNVLAEAASRLQEEHAGSMVLRHASARLLGQLRRMRIDHLFELEPDVGPTS